jgi:hypothetical protein
MKMAGIQGEKTDPPGGAREIQDSKFPAKTYEIMYKGRNYKNTII